MNALRQLYNACNPGPLRGQELDRLGIERTDLSNTGRPDLAIVNHLREFGIMDLLKRFDHN